MITIHRGIYYSRKLYNSYNIFVFCAMFNNNLQRYVLAEGKVTVSNWR